MTQRALIPIVAAARSQLKGLVDHSFEGIAYGESSLREFSAANLRAGSLVVASYSPNGFSNAGFAGLLLSKGTLNPGVEFSSANATQTIYAASGVPAMSFPAAKAGDSADAVFKYLETYGKTNGVATFAPGTQLTFLTVYEAGTAKVKTATGVKEAGLSAFVIDRFMIPNTETGVTELEDVNGGWKVEGELTEGATEATIVNSDGDKVYISTHNTGATNALQITVSANAASAINANCGGALILSRYVNGTWKRSTARLNIGNDPAHKYTFEDWLSVYQTTGSASKKYLNNGDETTGIQG